MPNDRPDEASASRARVPLTDSDREEIVALARDGVTRNDIARRVKRSPSTVTRVCDEAGVQFDRKQTQAATVAKQMDNKAKRAVLQEKLLEDALKIREQLWEPATVFSFGGRDNTYNEHTLNEPDFAGKNAIMRTVSVAVNASAKLAEQDRSSADPAAAVGLLDDIVSGLRDKYGTGDDEETPDDSDASDAE